MSISYISLLIPFAMAGIVLVVFLLALKLTVSVGTINGLIFYANIVAVNQAIFFPSGDNNILTVFIAWVNLDLGIETCFYDGMDAYARTWLQFVFPFYLWLLTALIILASHCSLRLSKYLGTNPVSVLATLFLLSYAKLLRTIISAFRNGYKASLVQRDVLDSTACGVLLAHVTVCIQACIPHFFTDEMKENKEIYTEEGMMYTCSYKQLPSSCCNLTFHSLWLVLC